MRTLPLRMQVFCRAPLLSFHFFFFNLFYTLEVAYDGACEQESEE